VIVDDTLYGLLPAVHRLKDAELGYPLRTLLRAINGQVDEMAAAIAQQYDDWFVETCAPDVLPYLAGLVGVDLGAPIATTDSIGAEADVVSRRAMVANALDAARRKGSFSVLEQLAADATGWPVRAVELAPLLANTPTVRFPGLAPRPLVNVADGEELEWLGTPAATVPGLADVRRVGSHRHPSLGNPTGIAIWLWRLVADLSRRSPACCESEPDRYTFDPLGRAGALCVVPSPRAPAAPAPSDLDVATPISRLALERRLEDYYGPERSLCVYRGAHAVPRGEILVADLRDWRHSTPAGHVSIDPELGRIAFPARHPPEESVWVRYARLSIGAIGGGHYERSVAPSAGRVYRVGAPAVGRARSIEAALAAWAHDKAADPALLSAVIEITDDGVYDEPLDVTLAPGEQLTIRAASGCRPILWPASEHRNRPDMLRVRGLKERPKPAEEPPRRRRRRAAGEDAQEAKPPRPAAASVSGAGPAATASEGAAGQAAGASGTPYADADAGPPPTLALDGVCVAGHPVELEGSLGAVTITNCTLLPARGVPYLDEPSDARQPSLVVRALPCTLKVSASVLGRVQVDVREVGVDPVRLSIRDSVVDAGDPAGEAIDGVGTRAWAELTLRRATVLGGARVRQVDLVQDSLVTGRLRCERRQPGQVRFSFTAGHSETPRRSGCQPDGVLAAVDDAIARGTLPGSDRDRERRLAIARVTPRFDAVRAGEPAYARLVPDSPSELTRGAYDEGELGAYHDLWQSLSVAGLRTQLQAFAPVGADIDIRFAT
jgi:hypothetical protein